MPKLAAKDRKKVEKADAVSGDFQPMPPGKYVATLEDVEARTSNAGNPMWVAVFNEIHNLEGEKQPGKQWYNLNLPTSDDPPPDYKPKTGKKSPEEAWKSYQALCAGRIKAFFEAFGYTVDSDTDEMIGDQVIIQVGIRTIQQGAKAGQKANEVNGVFALDSVDASAAIESAGAGASEDEF